MKRNFPLFVALAALALTLASPVLAQRRRPPRQPPPGEAGTEPQGPRPTVADIEEIRTRLESPNVDQVHEAIDLLSVIDDPAVVPPLAALLRSGQPDAITDRALGALQGLGSPAAIDVLVEFTHHRRAGARRRAYQALAAIQDPRIPALLEQGLRDSDRNVRATVARSLGDINARQSVDTLFLAFERGVVEAAISIGKLGDRRSITRFTEHLGRMPLSVMLSGYHEYLRREDIPEEVKVDVVGRLGEVSGPMVRSFLQRYLDTFPERSRSRVRQVVIDTLRRIPGAAAQGAQPAQPAPEAAPPAGGQP